MRDLVKALHKEGMECILEFYFPETVSSVARRHSISPSLLFKWRSQHRQGSLVSIQTDQAVVPASQYTKALDEIKRLQRLLGKSAAEKAILEEALEIAKAKKWIAR